MRYVKLQARMIIQLHYVASFIEMHKRILDRYLLLGAALILLLAACTGSEQPLTVSLEQNLILGEVLVPTPASALAWRIGFDRRLEPKEDVRQIASLANWLQQQTGLSFEVVAPRQGDTVVDEICSGEVDFAAVGTVSYLQAHHRCNAHILVRGLNVRGEDTYRAAIVTPLGSSLEDLAQLRGRSFAFGATNSTQGYLIPRLMLSEAGIGLDDLRAYTFHESHAATANAVASGRYDAGGLQDTLAQDLTDRGLLRILVLSNPFPSSGIIAGPRVPEKTEALVRQALLDLDPVGEDAEALYHWERSEMPRGFALARDADYDELRRVAAAIGLLEP